PGKGNGTQEAQKAQEGIQIRASSVLLVPLVFFSCASCAPFPICCAKPKLGKGGGFKSVVNRSSCCSSFCSYFLSSQNVTVSLVHINPRNRLDKPCQSRRLCDSASRGFWFRCYLEL